jgi:hypothetical protein
MVEEAVKSCELCKLNTKDKSSLPCEMSEIPDEPWKNLSADFYGPLRCGKYLLVVVDDGSHFPVCRVLS